MRRVIVPVILVVLVSLSVFVQCASSEAPDFDEEKWRQQVDSQDPALFYAPHVKDDGTFFNPWQEREQRPGGNWFLRRLKSKPVFDDFPVEQYAAVPNDYAYLSDPAHNSISFAGHASMIIKMDAQTIFTDPFFSNAALVVRKKVRIKFDFSRVPQKPIVLISHNHYDHLDKYSVKQLIKKDAVFIVPLKLKKLITKWGAKEVHELDWWQSVKLGTITYTLLPAQHWSRRIGQKGGATLWGGYLIEGSKTVYFSGDSGYFRGFAEFGKRYDIDYAIVGAGAYEPRWFMHYSHLNAFPEFFRAVDDLGAQTTIPMHFGVISLSDEPILYPLYETDAFIKKQPEYAERVRPLRVGEYLLMDMTETEEGSP
jgi:L-ascorbate metabolism protein UlaG (beta-lactamase superfamily)